MSRRVWIPRDPEARRLKQRDYSRESYRRMALARSFLVMATERGRLRLVPVTEFVNLLRRGVPARLAAGTGSQRQARGARAQLASIAAMLKQIDRAADLAAVAHPPKKGEHSSAVQGPGETARSVAPSLGAVSQAEGD